jgi:glycosyltransferase involved in cell wall biosynthesis
MRLAVDAINLRADDRGMGRLVRGMLPVLAANATIALLLRDLRDTRALTAQVPPGVAFAPVRSAAERGRYDAVWCPWNGLRFRSAAPLLVTICDDFAFRFPARGPIARRREQAPIRRAVREADVVVTISEWSRDALAARFGLEPQRIAVLPLAPDPAFFPTPAPSPYERPFVLIVAGSEPRKNLRFFIEAFDAAFPRRDVLLVVAGEPDAADRRTLQALGAVAGAVDDDLLRRLYRTARAVAVPSLAEGYGLVAAEAQACGAAVIASNASALPEASGNAALLLAPDDREGWIAGLRAVTGDAALNARLRAAGAARWALAPRDAAAAALAARLSRLVDERA